MSKHPTMELWAPGQTRPRRFSKSMPMPSEPKTMPIPQEFDSEQNIESDPLSRPASPIKTMVRRSSKSRPAEKVIHSVKPTSSVTSGTKGYNNSLSTRSVTASSTEFDFFGEDSLGKTMPIPQEFDSEQNIESDPLSPASPIKTMVRRSSKSRPAEKVIHSVRPTSSVTSCTKGYNNSLISTSLGKTHSLPSLGEIHRLDSEAVTWFRNVRSINMEASADSDQPKSKIVVRRRSCTSSRSVAYQSLGMDGINSPPSTALSWELDTLLAKQLNPEERAKLKQVFDEYDRDGSGGLDIHELVDMCSKLGGRITYAEAKNLMNQLDKDKSGAIDFEQFVLFWVSHPTLGKYRRCSNPDALPGMHSLMGGLWKTTNVFMAKNTLLSRLEGRRRSTIERRSTIA